MGDRARSVAFFTGVAIAGMLGIDPAGAQTRTAAADPPPDTGQLAEVTVTARYTTEALQDAPLAISTLSADQIQQRGFVNVSDIGTTVPNVTFQPTGDHYGKGISAYIRGVGQSDSSPAQSPAVGFYIDDVYVGTVNGANTALFDIDNIEVLRGPQGTLFGANSESGAVRIYSVKPKGDNSGYVEAGYGSYNHVIGKGVFDVALVPDKLFFRAGVTVDKQDGFESLVDYACRYPGNPYTGSLKPFTTAATDCVWGHEGGTDTVGLKAALRWLAADNLEVNIKADFTNDTGENPATKLLAINQASPSLQQANSLFKQYYGGLGYGPWFQTSNIYTSYATYTDPVNGQHNNPTALYRGYGFSGNVAWTPADGLQLKSITGYRTTNTAGPDSNAAPVTIVDSYQAHYAYQASEELDLIGTALANALDWTVGLFYFNSRGEQTGNIDIPVIGLPPNAVIPLGNNSTLYANQYGYLNFIFNEPVHDLDKSVFLHAIYHFTNDFSLEAGVRYTNQAKTFTLEQWDQPVNELQFPVTTQTSSNKRVDPKVGLQYRWNENLMTYASYATGFKGGGINPEATESVKQITPFGPETLKNYELGEKSELLDHRLRVNADVFHMIYTGLQLTAINNNLPVEENVGRAVIDGAELEIEARPIPSVLLNASGSYLRYDLKDCAPGCQSPENTGGVPPGAIAPQTPKWKFNAGLQYTLNMGDAGTLTPRIDYSYQSLVYNDPTDDPNAVQPGYSLVNAHLTWASSTNNWSAALTVANLTNKVYYTTKYDFYVNGTVTGNPGAPCEWLLTLRKNF
ncbi:MAG TPA: TonB-dependent receptor [Steroidobacteraceae bacterium]|nr:TonB-dependent receptor [Steroidobacteraceae bacterium]